MPKNATKTKETSRVVYVAQDHAKSGSIYLLTYIGAAWYFVQESATFWGILLGLLKAFVWPTFLIHRIFELIKL